MIGYEQTCLDCGTREAAGAYCTKCFGRNLDKYRTTRSAAQSGVTSHAAQKRAVASKETAKSVTQ